MSKPQRDPRGHSLRIYDDVMDSPAYASLSPHDVLAYLALLRELRQYNNGDLSLTLERAKRYGISHHVTRAKSLRALCAVGLVAVTRKGGAAKDGKRQATLYRVTDRECYEVPKKYLAAMPATNEWKKVLTVEQGKRLIDDYETEHSRASKLKTVGHAVTPTTTRRDTILPVTTTPRDTRGVAPLHGVTMVKKSANPATARVSRRFNG